MHRYHFDTWRGFAALYLPPVLAVLIGAAVLVLPGCGDAPRSVVEDAPPAYRDVPTVRVPALGLALETRLADELEEVWGVQADRFVALSAAQIHQESHWRPDARSPYAEGLTQFVPSTSRWIAEIFPDELWPADPWDPEWSIRAMVIYDHWLHERVTHPANDCAAWAFTLAWYNGGIGWGQRDRALCRLADHTGEDCHEGRWFGHVERYSQRARWAFDENRAYVRRILLQLTPGYIAAGFSGEDLCREVPA